ncbi:MAG: OmpA family protein [Treponema sp.]|jgi:outer membrane protein OmpA-like peptidoglycan-associated protein|nr:OmpA family protein [Treponema sp.]
MRAIMFKALRIGKIVLPVLLWVLLWGRLGAQDVDDGGILLSTGSTGPYTIVERSDWSRYDNGKYLGHVYHEVRASIRPEEQFVSYGFDRSSPDEGRNTGESPGKEPESFAYRGNFFVLEETLRDMQASARPVDDIIPVTFRVYRNGDMVVEEDRGFPSLRGFPAFPSEAVKPGSRWTAQGQRALDPKNTGNPVIVPFIAEYEYRGPELYRGIAVHRVSARYAMRYRTRGLGGNFSSLQGTHSVDILVQDTNGLPLLIRDNLDETFSWPDGSTLRLRGFTLIFSEGTVPINRETVIASMGNSLRIASTETGTSATVPPPSTAPASPAVSALPASPPPSASPASPAVSAPPASPPPSASPASPAAPSAEGTTRNGGETIPERTTELVEAAPGLDLVSVPEGVRLIVRDIRFIADSDEFLPEERPRLDIIAQALKEAAPQQNFLVEGHTASIGRPSGEMELSISRARRMVEELARRGIAEDRFIYKGWGGTKALGDNSTEQGRALNRRVEITILD